MMKHPISITALASISALGSNSDAVWKQYKRDAHLLQSLTAKSEQAWGAALREKDQQAISELRASNIKYKALDDTVLFALYCSREAVAHAGWDTTSNFGINIGSSRGATALFEKYFEAYLEKNKAETLSSPTTTLGNIASWVAHDLNSKGPDISHSITCATALHSLLNGVAWIQSGMTDKFLVGGSEAPLTPFTISQMKALKVYAQNREVNYPCKALDIEKQKNSMVLGEGAAVVCLEQGVKNNAIGVIRGIGYATEELTHNASISTNGTCFQESMKMAMQSHEDIDIIITHTPGTVKGDMAEINAIKAVFGSEVPALTTNKWKIGHTLGASGMLSVEMGLLMLQHQEFISVPYLPTKTPKKIEKILVNAVGFGGNAVSVLITKN